MVVNLHVAVLFLGCIPFPKSEAKIKIRPDFLRSVSELFRMKDEHFSFKMKVLASLQLVKQLQRAPVLFR